MEAEGWKLQDVWAGTTSTTMRLAGLWLLYRIALALYNISPFHPLARFPGPKLAAMTFLYEFWYEGIRWGKYTWEIERMHEKYGPIVRINPEELHCNDGEFLEEIYAGGGRIRDKQQHFLNPTAGALVHASFGTRYHEIHRIRRNAANKSFSRTQMKNLEPEIHELCQQFIEKLLKWREPVNLTMAYGCFTADAITKYCFGETAGFISQDGWKRNHRAALEGFTQSMYLLRYAPWTRQTVHIAPYIQDYLPEPMGNLFKELTVNMPRYVREATQGKTQGRVFSHLIESDMPDSEKTIYRLSGEGFSFITAGMETTAAIIAFITYHLLTKPEIRKRLEEDLRDVDPFHLDWQHLEGHMYLYGVIQEGLRMGYGISQRSPRIARTEDLIYKSEDGKYQYVVPKGTPIGESSRILHHNPKYFPDPFEFKPERWITKDGKRNVPLEKYILSFSMGSRICLGINLAICEMNLLVAALTLRVLPKMRLYETTADDVNYDHDLMLPMPRKGSKGIRAVVLP
ncbi:hypothetical protein GRF29_44g2555326 [Pseudopithomyces chartarum]|uniref:Cytochrome P450 n=1 Tax=Pseudopithomyces chartarum TaxID=1892770 RepID=A0AAN6RIX9_9PLEO|nr:hypothetical protein GRF29_44g2555326 [Pseudopithomyces chartarum]